MVTRCGQFGPHVPRGVAIKSLIVTTLVAGVLGASLFMPAVAQPDGEPTGGGVAAKPAPTIDTYGDWTGDYAAPFGRPSTSTFGQVITVPADETDLVRFRFYIHHYEGRGHLILRGEVYQWNGQMATGPDLWEGAQRRIAMTASDDWRRVGFRVAGVGLQPGGQYVLFASVSRDFEHSAKGYGLRGAIVPDTSYPSGRFVYLNDRGDEGQWTTHVWGQAGYDLAFKVWLRPHV
jgi:hypothetical protein